MITLVLTRTNPWRDWPPEPPLWQGIRDDLGFERSLRQGGIYRRLLKPATPQIEEDRHDEFGWSRPHLQPVTATELGPCLGWVASLELNTSPTHDRCQITRHMWITTERRPTVPISSSKTARNLPPTLASSASQCGLRKVMGALRDPKRHSKSSSFTRNVSLDDSIVTGSSSCALDRADTSRHLSSGSWSWSSVWPIRMPDGFYRTCSPHSSTTPARSGVGPS